MEQDRSQRLRSGEELIAKLPEIMPRDTDARIGLIYEDIQATLRAPLVNFIFRALANDPDFLATAWTNFRPFLRTLSLERAADELRSAALLEPIPDTADVGWSALGDLTRIRPFTDTIHYVLPKLLLVATAFDVGLDENAQPHGGMEVPAADLPRGVAEGAMKISMIDPAETKGKLQALFQEIRERHRHPGIASYYRSLGHWPEFLEAAWGRIKPLAHSPEYQERAERVVEEAARIIIDLPWPSRLWVRAFKTLNPTKDHIQRIRAILAVFRFRLIPDLLIDTSLIKAMLDGPAAARSSRFSVAEKSLRKGKQQQVARL